MIWNWIDCIDSLNPGVSACASKTFLANDPLFQEHFPDNPLVPGVIQIEMCAQLTGRCYRELHGQKTMALTKVKSAKFYLPLRPSVCAQISIVILSNNSLGVEAKGVVFNGEVIFSEVLIQMSVLKNDFKI